MYTIHRHLSSKYWNGSHSLVVPSLIKLAVDIDTYHTNEISKFTHEPNGGGINNAIMLMYCHNHFINDHTITMTGHIFVYTNG